MRKFETVQYLKTLNLPVGLCREFVSEQLPAMIRWSDYLRHEFKVCIGLRTDVCNNKTAGINCPFVLNISNAALEQIVNKYGKLYTYLIYDCPTINDVVLTQGIAYLLPDRDVLVFTNDVPDISCRAAIEDFRYQKYIQQSKIGLDNFLDIGNFVKVMQISLRAYLIRASFIDDSIIGRRIEWSWFVKTGLRFWQVSDKADEYIINFN